MGWGFCLVGFFLVFFFPPKNIKVICRLTSDLPTVGRHPACGQNADLECRSLDSRFCCCAQISVAVCSNYSELDRRQI